MKSKTFKIAEIFILVSLPVSLLVACNSDMEKQKDKKDKSPLSMQEQNNSLSLHDSVALDTLNLQGKVSTPATPSPKPHQAVVEQSQAKAERDIVKVPTKRVLNFASGRTSLNKAQRKLIKQHAQYLRYNPDSSLMISGYSDSQGAADVNYKISKKRADNVYREFRKLGIIAEQLEVRAYGEAFALQTAASGYDDRRVELDYVQRELSTTAMLDK